MDQLELHKKIEEFFKAGVESADVKVAQDLFLNDDAKSFFFSQANVSWLSWLWKNNFFYGIKNKAEDPTRYSYHMPELEYLTKMAEKDPTEVVDIINSVKIVEENFNPEVVYRFLWIIGKLPAERIKILTAKIRDEKWAYLMRNFNKSGYEFTEIVEKLVEKREGDALLELAQAVLIIKNKKDIKEKTTQYNIDAPFYIDDLDASGIFKALADIELLNTEKALQITLEVIGNVIRLTDYHESKIFDYDDSLGLFDVDFFTIKLEEKRKLSYGEDLKSLIAVIIKLIRRTISDNCEDVNKVRKIFSYIDKLPTSRSAWRLRLFALAQCPEALKEELKNTFFRLFEVENYYEIEGGPEYKKALKISFPYLSEVDQRDYVAKVFQYFSNEVKKNPDQAWHKKTGWEILSSICKYLKDDESQNCERFFSRNCDENFEPDPDIGEVKAGFVSHKSPVNLGDFTIIQIIINLESEWKPEKLDKQYKDDDFFMPRGVEGLGDALKEDIKKRTNDYLQYIDRFFNMSDIHPHYLYSLLRGLEEMLHGEQLFNLKQIGQIFGLFEVIKKEGEKKPFERKDDKSWLVDWVGVHKAITDILLHVLEDKKGGKIVEIQKEYREKIKNLISYLFTIKNSPSKEQEKPEYGELYHVAINSVRGRAFESFVLFVQNDSEKILAEDIKEIYRRLLNDSSLAVRFVIGRYLATFYFRDKEFIVDLFPEIFPKNNPDKKDIYLAAWEGYLSNTLYEKLFIALNEYYSYAITLDPKDYTQRKYLKGLDESLAVHLVLVFIYLGLEMSDPLFIQFWSKSNVVRHQEFISFIGRSILTRDQVSNEWLKENKVNKEKLINFWDWILVNKDIAEPKVFSGFGFWINPDKEILDDNIVIDKIAQTLKKSKGNIDWDYGLLKRLPIFAEKKGAETLEIILNYLLDSNNNLNQNLRASFTYHDEIKEAIKIIYKNSDNVLKQRVINLINILLVKGGSQFWGLKEVIK